MIFAAPTGITDDHELATIFQYQPVHAGWISPLDRLVAQGVIKAPRSSVLGHPYTTPYASIADMRGGFGNAGALLAAADPATADLDEIVQLQQKQATMQLVSTVAIVAIAVTAVLSALARKGA